MLSARGPSLHCPQGSAAARACRQLTQGGGIPFALRHSSLLASGIRPAAACRRAFSAQAAAAAPAAAVKHDIIKEAHGFKLEREQFVKEYDSTVLLYRHQRTGARQRSPRLAPLAMGAQRERPTGISPAPQHLPGQVLPVAPPHLPLSPGSPPAQRAPTPPLAPAPAGAGLISVLNSDENKTFGVVLRTPVDNSYGIPHILEHSVRGTQLPRPPAPVPPASSTRKAVAAPGRVHWPWGRRSDGAGAARHASGVVRQPQVPHQGALCGADEGLPEHLPQRLHLPRCAPLAHLGGAAPPGWGRVCSLHATGRAARRPAWPAAAAARWTVVEQHAPGGMPCAAAHPTWDVPWPWPWPWSSSGRGSEPPPPPPWVCAPQTARATRSLPPTPRTSTTWWTCTWTRCSTPSASTTGRPLSRCAEEWAPNVCMRG
jgi:hypothetical protein